MTHTELQTKLSQPYDPAQWKDIVDEIFPNVQYWAKERELPHCAENVERFVEKGTIRLKDGKNLALFEVKVDNTVNLPRARVKLRNLVSQFIDQHTHYGVLAIFNQGTEEYRLSLVAKETELIKGEIVARETPPKRYTYLLGPGESCRTAADRLSALRDLPEASLDDVIDAFSVEKLNKEFYRDIQKHFYRLVGGKVANTDYSGCLHLPSHTPEEDHQMYQEFAVRLIGRITFCWFLKHKRCNKDRPLIPEELLSSTAVDTHSGYYHAILEKLFFQTLNRPMNERSKYAPEFAHLIPYLNGGLFDPKPHDWYEEGALGASKYVNTLQIPDEWFLNLYKCLEQYNFTIDENTTLDNDVSIDPEILGRIFENLLAEINPETGETARKTTGSFYTPREIVDYMVEESLIQHLKSNIADDEEAETRFRALFVDDDKPHNLDEPTRKAVVNAFRTIKVLDPACGSGAFPVGILQKMLCALRKVDEGNDLWLDAQIEQIHTMKLDKWEVDRRLDDLEKAFKTNEADYGRKLGIIQNSVYGVDIQPVAIEIAKLRFFLTLVVDERIDDKEDNRGILPLPNLDFKFVAANTLIPAPETPSMDTESELGLEFSDTFFEEFSTLTEKYFYAGTPQAKQDIREKLEALVSAKVKEEIGKGQQLTEGHWDSTFGAAKEMSAQLKKKHKKRFDKISRDAALWSSYRNIFTGDSVGFFDPKYMFPDSGNGFDVVIANPPYVRQEEIKELKPAFAEVYSCYKGTADLLVYFYEKGCNLLKEGGVLTYITSNKYFRAGYGDKLRGYISENMQMRQLIDFGDAPVFDATAYPSIIVMQKGSDKEASESNTFQALNWTAGDSVSAFVDIFKNRAFLMKQSYLTLDGWQLDKPEIFELMQKLRNAGKPLGEYVDGKLYYGIKTGFNEAFVIDRETRDRLISEDPNCEEIIKPFLRGRDVKRWNIDFADKYLIKIESSENKTHPWSGASKKDAEQIFGKTYPSVQKRMLSCRDKLMKRCDQGHYYWELRSCVYYDIFAGSKLIYPDIAVQAEFAISYDEIYADCTLFATSVHGNYLPGVVNSTAVRFFLSNVCPRVRGDFMRFKTIYVSQIPIPQATSEQQSEIENLVERILKQKKANPDADVSELEEEINQIVYRLYGLTDEEIAIVEGV
ncbi:MAG: Eco57I restriction-modification methylase domain-containing protein [Kiritimatiellae bacterium]|jgi:adenine-specific DNA-methyltransferase|nr:Eco57I restriction-modification methylase domain-containing protein [Kiritimatiellia bacterium]